jgi:hypothetical protein
LEFFVAEYNFPHIGFDGRGLLEEAGPLLAVEITAPLKLKRYLHRQGLTPYSTRSGFALIDTGAAVSAIDESIFDEMEILSVDSVLIRTPHGIAPMKAYNASASFPSIGIFEMPFERIPGCDIRELTDAGQDVIMLLGRDILSNLVFVYDGPKSQISIRL